MKVITQLLALMFLVACGSDDSKGEATPNNVTMPAIFNNGAAWTAGFIGGPADCPIVWPARFDFEITGEGVLLSHGERMEPVGENSWSLVNAIEHRKVTITIFEASINIKVECGV